MTRPLPLNVVEAIAVHLAAWRAFQDAPDGKPAEHAEDELQFAAYRLAAMPAKCSTDVVALLAHLEWYWIEEGDQAEAVLIAMRSLILWSMRCGK